MEDDEDDDFMVAERGNTIKKERSEADVAAKLAKKVKKFYDVDTIPSQIPAQVLKHQFTKHAITADTLR